MIIQPPRQPSGQLYSSLCCWPPLCFILSICIIHSRAVMSFCLCFLFVYLRLFAYGHGWGSWLLCAVSCFTSSLLSIISSLAVARSCHVLASQNSMLCLHEMFCQCQEYEKALFNMTKEYDIYCTKIVSRVSRYEQKEKRTNTQQPTCQQAAQSRERC